MDSIRVNFDDLLAIIEEMKAAGITAAEIAINEPDPLDPGSPATLWLSGIEPEYPDILCEFDSIDAIDSPLEP